MGKQTLLEFENDEKMNAFMFFIMPVGWHYKVTTNSTIGYAFRAKEIKIAVELFGAKIVEKHKSGG